MSQRRALAVLACAHGVWAHSMSGTPLLFGLLFWSAGVLLLYDRIPERVGLTVGVMAALYGLLGVAPSTLNAAYLWAFLAGFVAPDLRHHAYRAVAATIYLFAGLNKVVSSTWRSGEIVATSLNTPWIDLSGIATELAFLTVLAELGLVVLLAVRYRGTWILMLFLHLGILATVSVNTRTFWALVNYGLLMVWFGVGALLSGRRTSPAVPG